MLQPVCILLQPTPFFATTVFEFCWKQPILCYHHLDFCYNQCVILLSPYDVFAGTGGSYFLGSISRASFLPEPGSHFFLLPQYVCFAGIGTDFCHHHFFWLYATRLFHFDSVTGDEDGRLPLDCSCRIGAAAVAMRSCNHRKQAATCAKPTTPTDSDDGDQRRGKRRRPTSRGATAEERAGGVSRPGRRAVSVDFSFFSAGEWLTRTKISLLIERLLAGISDNCGPTGPNLSRCAGAEYWPFSLLLGKDKDMRGLPGGPYRTRTNKPCLTLTTYAHPPQRQEERLLRRATGQGPFSY